MTILHFRAVIDGVHTSRRTLDLDASLFAFLSFLSFPPLIQLVPTQTRRARLPVCARKPLGGQVLFTARTLSRPIVLVDAFVRTTSWVAWLINELEPVVAFLLPFASVLVLCAAPWCKP